MGAGFTVFYVVLTVLYYLGMSSGSVAVMNLLSVVVLVLYLAMLASGVAYYAIGTGRLGQTVGKRVMGLRVVDIETRQPIGVGRAFGRYFYLFLMGLPCYLGYLTFFTDSSGWNRAWHDKMARSVVASVPAVSFGQALKDVWSVLRSRTG